MMKFRDLNKEQRAASARAVAAYLRENKFESLQHACRDLGQTPQTVWSLIMKGAGLPETDLPERVEITVDPAVAEKLKEYREGRE